jgi:cytochrome c peroxidase
VIRKALLAACALLLGAAAPEPQARFELGRRLFYDADLSRDGTVACATCHVQRHAFADSVCTHPGVDDTPGRRNVPGLANVAHFSPLTWADPRQTTLEAQLLVPVFGTHPVEMGMAIGGGEAEIARRLARDPCYRQMFAAAFPGEAQPLDFAWPRAPSRRSRRRWCRAAARLTMARFPPGRGRGRRCFAVIARGATAARISPICASPAWRA